MSKVGRQISGARRGGESRSEDGGRVQGVPEAVNH